MFISQAKFDTLDPLHSFPLRQPDPPSSNKWQLDSWLNKVQAQTKPLAPPRPEHHGSGESRSRCLTFAASNAV